MKKSKRKLCDESSEPKKEKSSKAAKSQRRVLNQKLRFSSLKDFNEDELTHLIYDEDY